MVFRPMASPNYMYNVLRKTKSFILSNIGLTNRLKSSEFLVSFSFSFYEIALNSDVSHEVNEDL